MITGSVTFSGGAPSFLLRESGSATPDISYHQIESICFSGGFYLHRRLPREPEDKYFVDEANDILVLFSGSVYNRQDLNTSDDGNIRLNDPEMIADLFLKHGLDFVKKLNGDFVIFILRSSAKEAFLFRDHIGVHPVAWVMQGETLTFSTDIMDLCGQAGNEGPIDSEFLLGYFKYIDYRRTANSEVQKLPPGHYLRFSGSGLQLIRYWEPEKIRTDHGLPYDRMLADLGELVRDAVRIRSDRRFTAGAHVSSGIDSGIVSALAREDHRHQEVFYGFSWSPDSYDAGDVDNDEREIIRRSCGKTGIRPVFSDLDASKFQDLVSDFYHNQGYFPEAATADQAANRDVNLIFTGWGGDEFISSGHSGIDLDLLTGMRIRTFFRRNRLSNPRKFIRHLLFFVVYPALHILDPGSYRGFKRDVRYIKEPFKSNDKQAISSFYFHRSRRQMHLNVFRFYNLPERCESWHVSGFQRGVEYRHPLLDRRIIEYMLKVPSEHLCTTGYFRPLLRELGKGILPDEVRLNQSKNDPVYRVYLDDLVKSSALTFMREAGQWKTNADLRFVDFDLLLKDIEMFEQRTGDVDEKILFRSLVYLKAINEFTKKYRESC